MPSMPSAFSLVMILFVALCAFPTQVRAQQDYPIWLLSQMPDTGHMRAGNNHYRDGFKQAALEKFILASRYGNLRSRIRIAQMYMNGDGIEANSELAWAWFSLAEMTKQTPWQGQHSPREVLGKMMDEAQLGRAQAHLDDLRDEHGPERVAKRILSWLRREKHKNRGLHSLIIVQGYTVTRDQFFKQLRRYVHDVYIPETRVRLRELELIDD